MMIEYEILSSSYPYHLLIILQLAGFEDTGPHIFVPKHVGKPRAPSMPVIFLPSLLLFESSQSETDAISQFTPRNDILFADNSISEIRFSCLSSNTCWQHAKNLMMMSRWLH
jgi:hypothetical protein